MSEIIIEKLFEQRDFYLNTLTSVMSKSCECGICGHHYESECMEKECKCCLNFHERSGSKRK